jgi:hypothetical protein
MNNDIAILQEKISRVESDIKNTQGENNERKRTTLIDYLAYLRDELKMLEEDDRVRKIAGR